MVGLVMVAQRPDGAEQLLGPDATEGAGVRDGGPRVLDRRRRARHATHVTQALDLGGLAPRPVEVDRARDSSAGARRGRRGDPRDLLDDAVQPLPRAGGGVAGHVAHEGERHAVEDREERLAPRPAARGRLPDVELALGVAG